MATARDVIQSSLREIGVLAGGETAGADDAVDGLATLNRLLNLWEAERLRIYTTTRTEWTITASTGQYAVGTGSTVNVARPMFVDHINLQDTSTSPDTETPLSKLTEDQWAAVQFKDQTATLPTHWYYNPTYATGTIDLWPVPTGTTLEGVLYAPTAVAQLAALTTAVSMPPGYEEMLVTALAVRLAPQYGREPSQALKDAAREAKATVLRSNKRLRDLSFDPGALIGTRGASGSYDIRQG